MAKKATDPKTDTKTHAKSKTKAKAAASRTTKAVKTTKVTKAVTAAKPTAAPVATRALKAAPLNARFAIFKKVNMALAVVLVLEAVGLVILGNGKTVSVTTQYLSVDSLATVANGHQVLSMATRHLFDISLPVLAAAFLLILAVRHFAAATKLRRRYERQLAEGVSMATWVSLAVVGGLMMVVIALLSGISQLGALLLVFVSTVLAGSLLPTVDRFHQRGDSNLSHTVCGVALTASLLPWLVILISIGGAFMYGGHLSGALGGVYASIGVLYVAILGVTNKRLQLEGGSKMVDNLYAERVYMWLLFIAASALAWQTLTAVS